MRVQPVLAAAFVLAITSACTASSSSHALPFGGTSAPTSDSMSPNAATSILKLLTRKTVIGSTVDPTNQDDNPYGLAISPVSVSGTNMKKGYAFVCNFNAKSGAEGTGTTVVSLAPAAGSTPKRFAQNSSLLGCTAETIDSAGYVWTTNFSAKKVTVLTPKGKVYKTYKGGNFVRPFSIVYATTGGLYPTSALWVSDASTGSIVLVQSCITGSCSQPNTPIVTGFKVNGGKPGNILGPSGLSFDPNGKNSTLCGSQPCGRLWVVDGANNTVVYIDNILNVRNAKSIVVGSTGKTFSGPLKTWAHFVYGGKPLNGPISAAVLAATSKSEGNLVVGNTLDPNGKNLLIELSPAGQVLYQANVDKGPMGALFGIASTGYGSKTKLYFNDDNENELETLSQ